MGVLDDLKGSIQLIQLFWYVPSENLPWISYEEPDWEEKETAKRIHSWNELDCVSFKVNGMSLPWKFFNLILVWLPKSLIWYRLASVGYLFLMETSGILDVTINAM